jgi:hypothetical protein
LTLTLSQAKLSTPKQHYYFDNNHVVQKGKVTGNLQYLIGNSGVSSYLKLSSEHQKFIQEIADIILTDEYVQNIEEHKKDKKIPYDIVSS